MDENTVVETAVKAPSKLSILKSRVTREGLLMGGVIAGIAFASLHTLFKPAPLDDIETMDENERTTAVNLDTLAQSGNL